jgi:hypothetical protein
MTVKRLRSRQSWHVLQYCRSVYLESLRKIMICMRLGKIGAGCVRIKEKRGIADLIPRYSVTGEFVVW